MKPTLTYGRQSHWEDHKVTGQKHRLEVISLIQCVHVSTSILSYSYCSPSILTCTTKRLFQMYPHFQIQQPTSVGPVWILSAPFPQMAALYQLLKRWILVALVVGITDLEHSNRQSPFCQSRSHRLGLVCLLFVSGFIFPIFQIYWNLFLFFHWVLSSATASVIWITEFEHRV